MKKNSLILILTLALTLMLAGLSAIAESGVGGDVLTWSLEEGVLTITGKGAMTNWAYDNTPPWELRKAEITSVVVEEGVTTIGSYAFRNCPNLISVMLPAGIETIGNYSFNMCPSLSQLNLPEGLKEIGEYALNNVGMEKIIIPDTVTHMGVGALENCTNLTEVKLPNGIEELSYTLLNSCYSLPKVTIPESVVRIQGYAVAHNFVLKEITLPASVKSIAEAAFVNSNNLTDVYYSGTKAQANAIKLGVDNISLGSATWHCSDGDMQGVGETEGDCGAELTWSLEESALTITGKGAMTNWSYDSTPPWELRKAEITSVVVEEGVTTIGSYAFRNCPNLISVMLPAGIETIGNYSFNMCPSLSQLNLPEGLKEIGEYALNNVGMEKIIIPDTVTHMGVGALENCTNLTEVKLPNGIEELSYTLLNSCYSLPKVTIPESVVRIQGYAVAHNFVLKEITLPASVKSIAEAAFVNSNNLTDVYYSGTKAQANAIKLGVDNISLGSATWHCSDGDMQGVGATSGICGSSMKWSVDGSTLSITGEGEMGGFDALNPAPWTAYKDTITELNISEGVTAISADAFSGMPMLASIRLPDSLETLGQGALANCTSLSSLTVPAKITSVPDSLLAGCTSLTQLTLPLGIEEIGAYALSSCTSLTDVYFEGSEEQAKMLPIGEGNEYLVRAHWHYRMDSEGNLESAVYWSLSEDGTLRIYGEGRMPDYSQDYSVPWHASQDKIKRVVVEKGVKNLGSYLFYGCKALTSVTLPDSLTAIGANAFDGCSTMIQVEIPQSVTSIGAGAFRNCTQLARVTLPAGKVKLGESAFSGCTTLKRLVLPEQLTEIPNYLLNGSGITGIVIPDAVTKIRYGAFSGCSALTSVTLPVSLEQIYDGAFSGAPVTDVYFAGSMADVALIQIALNNAPLQEATWHCSDADGPYPLLNGGTLTSGLTWKLVDGVLTISGSGVIPDFTSEFAAPWYVSRSSITAIVLEEGVRSIGGYAFRSCSQAAAVTLPESLIAIREHAFDGCSALQEIELPAQLRTLERYAFSGSGLASVTLPDALKTLGAYTFNGCKALKEIRLPAQITQIPDGFLMNTALTTLTIPEGVNTIYSSAFANNEQLTSVTLPASVRTVYSGVFNSTAVTDVTYAGKKADVQRISVSESNAPLTAATWHCADGDTAYTPAVSGYLTAELQWKLEGTTLKITGKGAMPDGLIPWHAYRTTITRVEAGEGVTGVSSSAFSGMTALESVSLPSTLKLVGRYAFNGCKALQTVSIPEETTAIEAYAFQNCEVLSQISLPASLTTLSYGVFSNCASLGQIALPAGLNEIPDSLFQGTGLTSVSIPDSVSAIGVSAFANCRELTSVSLPYAMNTIANGAFRSAEKLTDVSFAGTAADAEKLIIGLNNTALINAAWTYTDSVGSYPSAKEGVLSPDFDWRLDFNGTLIVSGRSAMPDCNSSFHAPWNRYAAQIRTLIIEPGVKTVGSYTFSDFTNLTSVSIPDTVTSIGEGAFSNDVSLKQITIPQSVTEIRYRAFAGSGLEEITLPDSVIEMEGSIFSDCDQLTALHLPAGLTTVPDSLCWDAEALTTITLPDQVRKIDYSAFWYCDSLAEISLPSSLQVVNGSAFTGCKNLKDVVFRGTAAEASLIHIALDNEPLVNATWHCTDREGGYPAATSGRLTADMTWMAADGVLTITGTGIMPDFEYEAPAPWHALAAEIERVEVSAGVDNIGNYAFSQLTALKEAALPDSVKRIGTDAFANTRSLTALTLPAGLTTLEGNAFSGSGLTEIILPDTLTSMGWGVFFDCEKLEKVTLSAGLTALPESAFWYCRALTALEIPDGVTTISPDALYGCSKLAEISLPDTILTVGSGAFNGCSALTDVTYRGKKANASTMSIASGNAALTGAAWHFQDGDGSYPAATSGALTASLQWRVEGDTLTITGRGTMPSFSGTSAPWQVHAGSIQKIVLEDGLKTISDNAFSGFNQLQEVAIPNTVTSIGRQAFSSASALKTVTIPDSVTSIGDYAFAYSGLVSADIPRSVTVLGNAVFEMCSALADVKLNANVNTIPGSMFWNCTSLKNFKIPEGIEVIGDYAFGVCYYLESVVLPASLQTVKNYAFDGCSRLTDVCYCYYESEEDAFYLQIDAGNAPLTDATWRYKQANPIVKMQSVLQLTAAVEVIPREAFEGTGIKAAEIPEGTGEIQSRAFANCPHLQYVSIPESVRTIAADAFEGSRPAIVCEEGGTIEAWAKEQGFECINP